MGRRLRKRLCDADPHLRGLEGGTNAVQVAGGQDQPPLYPRSTARRWFALVPLSSRQDSGWRATLRSSAGGVVPADHEWARPNMACNQTLKTAADDCGTQITPRGTAGPVGSSTAKLPLCRTKEPEESLPTPARPPVIESGHRSGSRTPRSGADFVCHVSALLAGRCGAASRSGAVHRDDRGAAHRPTPPAGKRTSGGRSGFRGSPAISLGASGLSCSRRLRLG
jgi:hypothetical protein